MPNLNVGLIAALMLGFNANAAEIIITGGTSINGVFIGVNDGKYYQCSGGVSGNWQSCGGKYGYVKIRYNSIFGSSGTPTSPFILSLCSFVSCVCDRDTYYTSNGCPSCPTGSMGGTYEQPYHTNTSCSNCQSGYFKYNGSCTKCPSYATCTDTSFACNKGYYQVAPTRCGPCPSTGSSAGATTSSAGSTSAAQCYIPAGTEFTDGTGNGTHTGDSYYCS